MNKEFLIVKVKDSLYAMDIFDIKSIIEYKQPTKVTGYTEEILGLVNHFDILWSVVDLRKFYCKEFTDIMVNENGEPTGNSKENKIILLSKKDSGLLVEGVLGIIKVEEEDIQNPTIGGKEYSVINKDGKISCIIDIDNINEILAEKNRAVA